MQAEKSIPQKTHQKTRGRPKKWEWLEELARQIIMACAKKILIGSQTAFLSGYTDAELARIIWERAKETGMMNDTELREAMIAADWVRRRRLEIGVLPVPRGGHRNHAGRPKGSRSASASQRKKPLRRVAISRETFLRWNAQQYAWDASRGRYVCLIDYTWDEGRGRYVHQPGEVVRPRDLPATLPAWGGGSGLPWMGLTKAKGQEWDAIRRGGK